MRCEKCDNDSFRFTWKWKDEEQRMRMYMMHDGLGYQLEDAYIECMSCGNITEPSETYDY